MSTIRDRLDRYNHRCKPRKSVMLTQPLVDFVARQSALYGCSESAGWSDGGPFILNKR